MNLRTTVTFGLAAIALAGMGSMASAAPMNLSAWHASAPALSQQAPDIATTSSFYSLRGNVGPDVAPTVAGAYVTAVLNISGTPCLDCVHGTTKGTFGSGYPLGFVNLNILDMGVLFEWFDVSFTGTCNLSVTLALGGKTLKTASAPFKPTPGSVENTLMSVTRANTWHGLATMTAKAICGAKTVEEKGTVYFQ